MAVTVKHLSVKIWARDTQYGHFTKPQYTAVVVGRLWDSLLSAAVLYNGHVKAISSFWHLDQAGIVPNEHQTKNSPSPVRQV